MLFASRRSEWPPDIVVKKRDRRRERGQFINLIGFVELRAIARSRRAGTKTPGEPRHFSTPNVLRVSLRLVLSGNTHGRLALRPIAQGIGHQWTNYISGEMVSRKKQRRVYDGGRRFRTIGYIRPGICPPLRLRSNYEKRSAANNFALAGTAC